MKIIEMSTNNIQTVVLLVVLYYHKSLINLDKMLVLDVHNYKEIKLKYKTIESMI